MSEEQHETHRDRQESSTVQNSVDTMTSLHKTQTKENKKESTKKDIIPVKCRRVARWYLGKTLGKGGYSWFVHEQLYIFCFIAFINKKMPITI